MAASVRNGFSGVLQTGGIVDHQASGLDFGGHLGHLELDTLEVADGATELLPLLDVLHRMVQRTLGQAHHLGPDTDSALVEGFDGDLVSLAHLARGRSPGAPGHSRRINSVVEDARMPSLSSFFPTVNPSIPFSTMKAVMPLYPAPRDSRWRTR